MRRHWHKTIKFNEIKWNTLIGTGVRMSHIKTTPIASITEILHLNYSTNVNCESKWSCRFLCNILLFFFLWFLMRNWMMNINNTCKYCKSFILCFNTLVFGLFFNMLYDRSVDAALRSRAIAFRTIHIDFIAKMCSSLLLNNTLFAKSERRTTLKSVSTEWRSIHFSQTITLKWNNLPFLIRTSCFVQTLINWIVEGNAAHYRTIDSNSTSVTKWKIVLFAFAEMNWLNRSLFSINEPSDILTWMSITIRLKWTFFHQHLW